MSYPRFFAVMNMSVFLQPYLRIYELLHHALFEKCNALLMYFSHVLLVIASLHVMI